MMFINCWHANTGGDPTVFNLFFIPTIEFGVLDTSLVLRRPRFHTHATIPLGFFKFNSTAYETSCVTIGPWYLERFSLKVPTVQFHIPLLDVRLLPANTPTPRTLDYNVSVAPNTRRDCLGQHGYARRPTRRDAYPRRIMHLYGVRQFTVDNVVRRGL